MTPNRRLLAAVFALCLFAFAAAFFPALEAPWKIMAGLTLGAALLDLLVGRRLPPLLLRRELRHSVPLGVWSEVRLILQNRGRRDLRLELHDHHPPQFDVEAMPLRVELPALRGVEASYRVRPKQRGDGRFSGIDLLVGSPLGLWQGRHFLTMPERVRVFPNFHDISHYALLATDHRLSQIGVRRRRRRGEGSEFHQLREYRFGDSLRQIDWRATSRYRRLIAKDYQDERDQQIIFLLDCGRRMRHEENGCGHLDQALNAMLLLAYVAARQGDAVGFMAFGGQRRWYPPRKGGQVVRELLHQTYDLTSSIAAADYLQAARELVALQRRRALIVLITNTRDEDDQDLTQAVRILASRHLVVLADLRETFLDRVLQEPVSDFGSALRFQSVSAYLSSRSERHDLLRHHGVRPLDLLAAQLPIALVNQYLSIKASNVL